MQPVGRKKMRRAILLKLEPVSLEMALSGMPA